MLWLLCLDGYRYRISKHFDKQQQRHVLSSADSEISCKNTNAGKERRHNGKGDTNQTKSIACFLFSGRYSHCVSFLAVCLSCLPTTTLTHFSCHDQLHTVSVMATAFSHQNILVTTVGVRCPLDH